MLRLCCTCHQPKSEAFLTSQDLLSTHATTSWHASPAVVVTFVAYLTASNNSAVVQCCRAVIVPCMHQQAKPTAPCGAPSRPQLSSAGRLAAQMPPSTSTALTQPLWRRAASSYLWLGGSTISRPCQNPTRCVCVILCVDNEFEFKHGNAGVSAAACKCVCGARNVRTSDYATCVSSSSCVSILQ